MNKDTKEQNNYNRQQQLPYGSPRSIARTNGDGVLIPDDQQEAECIYSSPVPQHGYSLPYATQCYDENGVVISYFQPQYTVIHHFVAVHHGAMIPQNLSQDFFCDQVNEPQSNMQHQYPHSSQQYYPNPSQTYYTENNEAQKQRSRRSKRRFRRSRQRSSEFNAKKSDNESSDMSTIATMESSSVKTNM
ncbi:predicted protein [Chaetoceros tenuissimus]|uniref:Uncharacterized protein n=1 Tax=Chaetoceros tenuissimus TaxID=426638 RepID=A0AAD3HAM0_9STRA|nr:predicted protein [Chaetoceros tenuissimus]